MKKSDLPRGCISMEDHKRVHPELGVWDFSGFGLPENPSLPSNNNLNTIMQGLTHEYEKEVQKKKSMPKKPFSRKIISMDDIVCEWCNDIYGVSFSPDGKYLATGCADGTARILGVDYNKEKLTELIELEHHGRVRGVNFSPDGKYLATGCGKK
ncbi:MAG: hypothetical protein U9Q69_00995, partial [Nanoarchaeota archaeon]|nr:hypothetical protein [Nanoarchaeota archaeon]